MRVSSFWIHEPKLYSSGCPQFYSWLTCGHCLLMHWQLFLILKETTPGLWQLLTESWPSLRARHWGMLSKFPVCSHWGLLVLASHFETTLQIILYKNFTWKNFCYRCNGMLLDLVLKMLFAFKRTFWREEDHFFFRSTNGAFLTCV